MKKLPLLINIEYFISYFDIKYILLQIITNFNFGKI